MHCTLWKNKFFLLFALFVLLVVTLTGCTTESKKSISFFSMDTIMQITAYGKNAETALPLAREKIQSLEKILCATKDESVLTNLHSGDALSSEVFVPMQTAKMIADYTGGALDITLYPVTNAWGFYNKNYKVPTDQELQNLLANKGTWTLEKRKLVCSGDIHFDLGSVAKGFAAMRAVDVLKENGIESAILSLGGNVQTIGTKPDGSLWRVSIANPFNTEETVGEIQVGESAVVTSGSYQRNFTQDGKTYHHILDPVTGKPVENGLCSITIITSDGTVADGLSTALFVRRDLVSALYQKSGIQFEAILITNDKEILVTPGIASSFKVTNETFKEPTILQ